LLVRQGPTRNLPLHDNDDDNDTIEIPETEILGRIFIKKNCQDF